jgi:hypothetical protein
LRQADLREADETEERPDSLPQNDSPEPSHTSTLSVKLASTPRTYSRKHKLKIPRRLPVIPEEDEVVQTPSAEPQPIVNPPSPIAITVSPSVEKTPIASQLPVPVNETSPELREETEIPVCNTEIAPPTPETVTWVAPEPTSTRPHRHERFYDNIYSQQ